MMKIRYARLDEAGEILEIYAPYILNTAITFEYNVPSLPEFRARMDSIMGEYPYFVAEEDGEILGYAYLSSFHSRAAYKHVAETSIYIKKSAQGRGIGKLLYEALEKEALKQNIYTFYACITETDRLQDDYLTDGSIRFHEHLGYTLIGRHKDSGYKFDRWYSVIWMEKNLAAKPDHPAPFIPYPAIVENKPT